LAPKPAPDGNFSAAHPQFFFSSEKSVDNRAQAVLPAACQTLEILVKLTWSAQDHAQPLWHARNSGGFFDS
jgi:hypothetical protein